MVLWWCCWNAVVMLLWCCCDAFVMLLWCFGDALVTPGQPIIWHSSLLPARWGRPPQQRCSGDAVLLWCCCFLPCNSTSIKKTVIKRSTSISIICEYQENRKKHVIYKAAASSSLPSPVREGSPLRCTGWQTGSVSSWEISSKLCQVCCVTMYDRLNS